MINNFAWRSRSKFIFYALAIFLLAPIARAESSRLILNFNQGWRFERMDSSNAAAQFFFNPKMDDQNWELVNVPHSVRLEPWNASGGQNFQGICWYRKHFTVKDDWKNKKLFLKFDGAMQVAEVWLNGKKMMTHYGGYLPFVLDITSLVKFDSDNVVVLRLDNSDQPLVPPGKPQRDLDFTYFGGLYRDVHFIVTDRLHVTDPILANKVAGGGIFVTYPRVNPQSATVQVKTETANEFAAPKNCTVKQELLDTNGIVVASTSDSGKMDANTDDTFTQTFQVAHPKLWNPNHPNLYSLRTRVYDGDALADEVTTRIGIRTFEFRPDGLFINGERFFSVGFNHHQDFPYIGYAVPDSLQFRDVKKLREAGMTSFRSHYPHSPAFMDACDELGVLTIVSTPGWQYFTNNTNFLARSYQDTREMIRWNRNRPSVILWEIGLNESPYSEKYAETAQRIAHEEFPVAPCYTSGDGTLDWQKTNPVFDVLYNEKMRPPPRPLWWREFGDGWDLNWEDQIADNRVARGWGEAAMLLQAKRHEQSLRAVMDSDPPVTGADLWAGIDCDRGYHPMPFLGGILDKARLPKFSYYMFASQRPAELHVPGLDDGPMVFIASLMEHFSSRNVTVFSNCQKVRLWREHYGIPDELVGEQNVVSDGNVPHAPLIFTNALKKTDAWRLKAQGLVDGKVMAQQEIGASGVARKLSLRMDKCGRELVADGSDIILIYATIQDKNGNTVPFDDRLISFSISGAGKIIGDASIGANPVRSELGIATLLVRSTPHAGKISVHAQAQGLSAADIEFESRSMTEGVVSGRDVRRMSTAQNENGERLNGMPAVMPNSEVMKQQRESQNLRNDQTHQ